MANIQIGYHVTRLTCKKPEQLGKIMYSGKQHSKITTSVYSSDENFLIVYSFLLSLIGATIGQSESPLQSIGQPVCL